MKKLWVAGLLAYSAVQAAVIGQIDDFEDGTTQGWVAGGGPIGQFPPVPPANIPAGGPAGASDNYLQITSQGGNGPGGRLVALNPLGQWAGNYTSVGLSVISMDLINLGQTDLAIRLYLENPIPGPPTDDAVTDAFLLPAGGGWQHAAFDVSATGLTVLNGSGAFLLSNVTVLRIIHNPAAGFPPPAIAGVVGVDNICAGSVCEDTTGGGGAVPEPSTLGLAAVGLLGLALRMRRN